MRYTYRFANGDVNEIEVTEDQAFALTDLDRLEYNNDHTNTRRHISLEMAMEDEGMQFGSVACWEQALSADNVNTMLIGLTDEHRFGQGCFASLAGTRDCEDWEAFG